MELWRVVVYELAGGWGDRGGMAHIDIASSHRTMIAVFVEITYQMNGLEAEFQCFGKNEMYFKVTFEYIEIDEKTYWMIQSMVPDLENNPIFMAAIPDHCVR